MRSKPSIRHRAALLLLLPLLLGSATASPPSSPTYPGPLAGHPDRAALAYAEAATAVRRKDCTAVYKALTPILSGHDSEAGFAQLLLGLYARSCGQVAYSEERLFAAKNSNDCSTHRWTTHQRQKSVMVNDFSIPVSGIIPNT